MAGNNTQKLHWKLFFPLIGLLWLIIGITIVYFVRHEKHRQKENLENRLLNVNNTVIDAYERNVDLQETVDFIRLFTDNTTLAPLRITVYDITGNMIADNPEPIIPFYKREGKIDVDNDKYVPEIKDVLLDDEKSMISSRISTDGKIYSFAALPYEGEVTAFLSIDPMVWIVVIILGLISSIMAYFGLRAVCRNVYNLQEFARAASSDNLPDNIDSMNFTKDELGEVSRNLLTLYRDKIHAEQEKLHHEQQIGMNISHELNTPIGIVKGYLDTILASDDMPAELRKKFLLRAQENTKRLSTLVNDVSMVMRLQENSGEIKMESINFHSLAIQLSEDIAQSHITENMKFDVNIPEKCIITGHESLLTNALLNLTYNAAQHSSGSMIKLEWIQLKDGMHTFTFSDNGRGVEEEHLERLFDLFYRVDYGRSRKNGGSGLGLPLVRRIINAMDGNISVENAEGGGLKFTFSLPAA